MLRRVSHSDGIINLAIVGCGSIAAVHAEAISLLPEARLVAVHGRNMEKAAAFAKPWSARPEDSISALAAAGDIDAVLIASPSGTHAKTAIPLLEAGKSVLCEKPLEINTRRIRRMIDTAGKAGVLLAGFFPLRAGLAAKAVKRAAAEGRFGRLTFISARVKWWRNREYYQASDWRGTNALDGGGALMNQGIHAVDLMQWFAGPIREASGFRATLVHSGIEVEDTLSASVRFESGALGTMEAATSCYPGFDLSIEVSGDRGTAVLCDGRMELWRFQEERPEDRAICEADKGSRLGGGTSDPKSISSEGHRRQIADFCRALRGEASEVIGGREAARAVAAIEAIYRSAHRQRIETVDWA